MRQRYIAVTFGGLLLLVVSCHHEDIPTIDSGNTPIEFSKITSWLETKSEAISTTSVLSSNDFKVWAQNGSNYDVFGANGTKASTSDDGKTCTYSPVRYWKTGIYNFYAVSPADWATGELSEDGLTLSFSNGWDLTTEQSQTDLLIATQTVNGNEQVNRNDGPDKVKLTFDHMLSKTSFSARNASVNDDVGLSVTNIKVYGMNKVAMSVTKLPDGKTSWSLKEPSTQTSAFKDVSYSSAVVLTKETIDKGEAIEYKYTNVCPTFMFFPERESFVVEVTYNQTYGKTTTTATKSVTINTERIAGYEYDFKLKVTEDAISIDGEPGVVPWVSKDDDDNDLVVDDTIVI